MENILSIYNTNRFYHLYHVLLHNQMIKTIGIINTQNIFHYLSIDGIQRFIHVQPYFQTLKIYQILKMKIQFESSVACNSNCIFCPIRDITRPKGEMSDELFHKIIKESKVFRNPEIVPFLNGEPFLFPRIWEWLDYMKKEKCHVYLFTNAALMDVDRLIKYTNIRYVCCSVNASTKETHKNVMRGPDYDVVEAKVKDLIKKAPFPVYVSMVEVEKNIHEKEEFKKKWGKNAVFGEFKNWGGDKHDKLERTGKRVPCLSLLRAITILWDGRVAICCLDYDGKLIVGDANKQTLLEINIELNKIRKRHKELDFNFEPCRKCNQNIV